MTTRRDPDLLIRQFLDEGSTELPDRAFDSVRFAIERTRQRAVLGPWREPTMFTTTRVLALAALIVIAIGAIFLLPKQQGVGGAPTPSPAPTPTDSPTPTSTPFTPPTEVACSVILTTPADGGSILRAPLTVQMSTQAYPIIGTAPSPNPVKLPYAQVNFRVGGLTPPASVTVAVAPPAGGAHGFGTVAPASSTATAVLGSFVLDSPGDWHLQINVPSDGCQLQLAITVLAAPA